MSTGAIRPFLGVEKSLTGRLWQDRLDARGRQQALALSQQVGLGDVLSRVLAGRGVLAEDAEHYLEPSIRNDMPDPSVLTGMGDAVERITRAITKGEQVALFGDYDVDGATSTALMALFLRTCGLDPFIHIPDRIFEGYGPNIAAITSLRERGASLLVTLDCGTTSHEVLGQARALGLDVVVIDHHQADETLPEVTALVNPNRRDDLSGLGYLAACGVTFMVLVALNRALREQGFWAKGEPDLMAYLDIVALGTVADVVPLKGLNRAFVTRGLIVMKRRERAGLRALMDVARLSGPPSPYHLGFLLGPRINAGGRIGDAALGTRLLTLDDDAEAMAIAAQLDRLNQERQVVEQDSLVEAEAEAVAALGPNDDGADVLVCAADNWHPGVVGLLASRLKERFKRPAFAIAFDGEIGTGSGRSVQGVDLGAAIREAVAEGLVLKGGGHAMAAGVTLRREALGAFRAFLEEKLARAVSKAREGDHLLIDAAVTAGGLRLDLLHELSRAGPFGSGNPEPVFALPSHKLIHAEQFGQGGHVRLRLRSGEGANLEAVAFRVAEQPLGRAIFQARGQAVHFAGQASIDHWQGREKVSFRLIDMALPTA